MVEYVFVNPSREIQRKFIGIEGIRDNEAESQKFFIWEKLKTLLCSSLCQIPAFRR